MAKWSVWTDGSSYGNPGPSGCGYQIQLYRKVVAYGFKPLGVATNNVAEYAGIEAALLKVLEFEKKPKSARVVVRTDSELIVRQLKGEYAVRSKDLKPYYKRLKAVADKFLKVKFIHIRRDKNEVADFLANQGSLISAKREANLSNG